MKEGGDEQPWIEIHFPELKNNRMRLSSNREYYYDVDYLTSMGFSDYKIEIENADGEWVEVLPCRKLKSE